MPLHLVQTFLGECIIISCNLYARCTPQDLWAEPESGGTWLQQSVVLAAGPWHALHTAHAVQPSADGRAAAESSGALGKLLAVLLLGL
jgi:hypothetical protein